MPHCEFPEVWVAIWKAWQRGERRRAGEIHRRFLPFHLFAQGIREMMAVHKEVLRRRGIIQCARVRSPAVPGLSPETSAELNLVLDELGFSKNEGITGIDFV